MQVRKGQLMSAGKQSVLMLWHLWSPSGSAGRFGVGVLRYGAVGPHMGWADGVGRMSVSGF